jgi:hypothetical protein
MRRRTTASALAAVGLFAGLTTGQPPAPPAKAPADPTDVLIQKALANDPDIQVARAKLALAEAEVMKARQAAVARVLTLRDAVTQHKATVARLMDVLKMKEAMRAAARSVSNEEVLAAQERVAVAQAELARAETELRLMTGEGPKAAAPPRADSSDVTEEIAGLLASLDPQAVARALDRTRGAAGLTALAGPVPARLARALEKKVSLGEKGRRVTLEEALEGFKARAGFDIPVRPMPSPMPEIVSDGVELPVIAWLQMFQDLGGRQGEGFAFYVREYGLLVANRQTAPPDAVSLTAFWRAVSEEAARPPVPAPATKQPTGKRHDFPHDKLPATLKAKVGDAVVIQLPVKVADVEDAKTGSDNASVVARLETANGMVAVVVRADRPGKALVVWNVTTASGRQFSNPGREVEFE